MSGNGITIDAITPDGKTDNFIAWGAAAGGGQGDAGIAGSVGLNIISTFDTEAYAASGSTLNSSGDLTVKATASVDPQTVSAGVGFSEGTAVGVAVSVAVVNVTTNVYIAGTSDASGATTVDAEIHVDTSKIDIPLLPDSVKPSATTVAVAGGASNGDVGIGGAVVVNDFTLKAHAYIADGAEINQTGGIGGSGQTVSVTAENDTNITTVAGALGLTTGSAGVGASVDVEILHKETFAYIGDDNVRAGGDATDKAHATETMLSVVATAGGADTAGVAGSVSVSDIHGDTEAYLADGGTLTGNGADSFTATDAFKTTLISGSVGIGGTAGVGAAATILLHTDNTLAYVGANTTVSGTGLTVTATESEDILSLAVDAGVGGDAGVAGAAPINILNETTTAYIGHGADVTITGGSISVGASDTTLVISVAGSLGSGGASVGVGADVGTYNKTTYAYIDSGVTATADGDIQVTATSSESLISVAAGIAVGEISGR